MEYHLEEIKGEIDKETKEVFINYRQTESFDLIDLLFKVIRYPIKDNNLNLEGLETRMLNAFMRILVEGVKNDDRETFFADFGKVEPLFRKILFLIDPISYEDIKNANTGLSLIIKKLELNPLNKNLDTINLKKHELDVGYIDHIARVYRMKNSESHVIKKWSHFQFGQHVQSCLMVYLFAVKRHKNILLELTEITGDILEPTFNQYCDSIILTFKERATRFIPLSSKEDITLSGSYVTEYKLEGEKEDEAVGREGLVETLRLSNIPEKRMMLWGEAGLGKSTTLEYLSYRDANKRKADPLNNLPVYIQLGLLTDPKVSIEQYIFRKVGIEESMGKQMLTSGRFNLFLDGLNEIPKDGINSLVTLRFKEIETLLKDYKNTFVIMTNRPEQINLFSYVPVFFIQKMNDKQIKEFVKKYTVGKKNVEDKINKAIDADERLKRIIKSPLMLSRLIEIVKSDGEIPQNEGLIIDRFIRSLYKREIVEKKDARFNEKQIHRLLAYLASYSIEEKGTNAGMSENEVANVFIKCKKEYGFEVDVDYVLDISCQLNLLERYDEKFVFSHQSYQDYFVTEYERMVVGV